MFQLPSMVTPFPSGTLEFSRWSDGGKVIEERGVRCRLPVRKNPQTTKKVRLEDYTKEV